MRTLLVTLSVIEVLLVVAVLAYYLIQISKSLHETSRYLAKITFGVRAVETQCSTIGPNVVRINEQLNTIAGAVAGVADKAELISERG